MYLKIRDKVDDESMMVEVEEFNHRVLNIPVDAVGNVDFCANEMGLGHVSQIQFLGNDWGSHVRGDWNVRAVLLLFPAADGRERAILAVGCSVFVMGPDGQTIDRIRH